MKGLSQYYIMQDLSDIIMSNKKYLDVWPKNVIMLSKRKLSEVEN